VRWMTWRASSARPYEQELMTGGAARKGVSSSALHSAVAHGRGLHSSSFRLNVSAFCGIGCAFRGCLGGI